MQDGKINDFMGNLFASQNLSICLSSATNCKFTQTNAAEKALKVIMPTCFDTLE